MTTMKRTLSVLAAAGMLAAGCGSAKPSAVPQGPGPQAPAQHKLVKGEDPGTTIQVGYEPGKLPEVHPTFTDVKTGPLLFSDDPEFVDGEGVMLHASVRPGDFRFYLYHANNNADPSYYHIVVTNPGSAPATVKVGNNALAGPGNPYGPVGFQMQTDFYQGQKGYTLSIKPGEAVSLDPRLEANAVKTGDLEAGIWDVVTDQPLQIDEIASYKAELPKPAQFKPYGRSGHSGAGAGTFTNYERNAVVNLDGSRQMYKLASGQNGDSWLTGKDELHPGTPSELVGNYGMDYHVTMNFNSPVDRTVKVYMSTVMKLGGAIKVDGKMIKIPTDNFGNIDAPYDSTLIAKLDLKAGKTTSFNYDFMPPGAFYLPAIIHVDPVAKN